MQTRKDWRNREPSAGERVTALLGTLREGLGASSIGLFDDDRAGDVDGGDRSPPNFWDAFDQRPCGAIDWDTWYGDLRRQQRVDGVCGCGQQHRLCGFLIHDRWALLVVAPPALPAGGAAAIASSLRALADALPPGADQATRDAIAADPAAAVAPASARSTWWIRKPPH